MAYGRFTDTERAVSASALPQAAPMRPAIMPPREWRPHSAGRDSTALLHATARGRARAGRRRGRAARAPRSDARGRQLAGVSQTSRSCWRRPACRCAPGVRSIARQARSRAERRSVARRELPRGAVPHGTRRGRGRILLAHHRRDQAETVLLQALRGAGPAGAGCDAGAPGSATASGGCASGFERPREALRSHVRQHKLRFVDDESNGR